MFEKPPAASGSSEGCLEDSVAASQIRPDEVFDSGSLREFRNAATGTGPARIVLDPGVIGPDEREPRVIVD